MSLFWKRLNHQHYRSLSHWHSGGGCNIAQQQGFVKHTQSFVRYFSTPNNNTKKGLFTLSNLHQPSDFIQLASDAITKCNSLRNITSIDPKETLYRLDDISNTVCSVIDASELCRSVHKSEKWRTAASTAFQMLSEYISDLNSDVRLHQSLIPITSNTEILSKLTNEEQRFAILLQREFETNGIHLTDSQRNEVCELSSTVTQLETLFTENIQRDDTITITNPSLMDPIQKLFPPSQTSSSSLKVSSGIGNSVLEYDASLSPSLRKELYILVNTSCPNNLQVLDQLIQQRHLYATTIGYPSYAHYFIHDKTMAQDPRVVHNFLKSIETNCQSGYQADMELLQNIKSQVQNDSSPMKPWEVNHYIALMKAHVHGDTTSALGGYFTVNNCIDGMKLLMSKLFDIQMIQVDLQPQEQWDLDTSNDDTAAHYKPTSQKPPAKTKIQKFEFHQEENGLGTMYLDLHPRQGKYGHAAHFTIQCGCKVRTEEKRGQQLPIIALVCNLSPPSSSSGIAILSHQEVETLFHEFGHAVHSLLSRTSFQHLSGTRAPMDFVETPSQFMEQYVWNEEFLSTVLAQHYITGSNPSKETINNLVQSKHAFQSIAIQTQMVHSKFDQMIFNQPELWQKHPTTTTTTKLFGKLHQDHNVPYQEGTHFHTRFGHLVTYGAGYYGYLYASVFAADLWDTLFNNNPFARNAGMKYWKELLIHGGAKDPNGMLKTLLGRTPKVDSFFKSFQK